MNFNPLLFVVEDDIFYQNIIVGNLKTKGYTQIKSFSTGEDCEKNLNQKPGIILLDYMLGSTTGLDVLKKIKSILPDSFVIFLSGQDKIEVAVESMKYGAFDYVLKNDSTFDKIDELFVRIEEIIKTQKAIAQIRRRYKIIKWSIIASILLAIGIAVKVSGLYGWLKAMWLIWMY